MKGKSAVVLLSCFILVVVLGVALPLTMASTGTITLSVTSGSAGTAIQASSGTNDGWHKGATVTLKWDDGTVLGSTTTNSGNGKWSMSITIPSSAAAGTHIISGDDAHSTTGTAAFTVTVTAVSMIVSYHINDGTTPSSNLVFHYKDTNGASKTYTLTTSAHTIANVGAGLPWSVDNPVGSSNEQWTTTTASGNAPASGCQTVVFSYRHQYQVNFNVNPSQTGATTPQTSAWYDAGSSLNPISANANQGYSFSSWTKTGAITIADSTLSSTTFSLTGSGTLTANFQVQTIQTQITIIFTPPQANPSEPITLSGKLSLASDPTVGVANKQIALSYFDGQNWEPMTTATTAPDGSYSVQWTLPSDMPTGPHLVKVAFLGDNSGASPQYLACESVSNGLNLYVLPEYTFGSIIAFSAIFFAFIAYKKRGSISRLKL